MLGCDILGVLKYTPRTVRCSHVKKYYFLPFLLLVASCGAMKPVLKSSYTTTVVDSVDVLVVPNSSSTSVTASNEVTLGEYLPSLLLNASDFTNEWTEDASDMDSDVSASGYGRDEALASCLPESGSRPVADLTGATYVTNSGAIGGTVVSSAVTLYASDADVLSEHMNLLQANQGGAFHECYKKYLSDAFGGEVSDLTVEQSNVSGVAMTILYFDFRTPSGWVMNGAGEYMSVGPLLAGISIIGDSMSLERNMEVIEKAENRIFSQLATLAEGGGR